MYDIRFAYESDVKALIQFIDQHYNKGHILATCKELLNWQHLDRMRGRYNFVVGVEKQTKAIHGVLGFITLTQFDPDIELGRICWLAIWRVQEAARGHKLGRCLLSYLEDTIKPGIIAGISASAMTLPMYQARGYHIGRLSHYFILNPEKSNFYLVIMKGSCRPGATVNSQDTDKRIEEASESDIANGTAECFLAQKDLPRKSPRYLINRYLRHSFYRYHTYRIREGAKTTGIIVTRICSYKGSKAIRIVDFIGQSDALRRLRGQWIDLLKNFDAEYLDFYNAGIKHEDLLASGFTRREVGDGTVIPNYFEPFFRENIEIDYAIRVPVGQTYRIVKGDSDQDRPNLIGGTPS